MRISEHLAKFNRFDECRTRFDRVEDFELWFWLGLSAGTAIINAALHAARITEENAYFATQVPDVYAFQTASGEWEQRLAFKSDLIHVGLPAIEAPLSQELTEVFSSMEVIERYRDPCIRGEEDVTAEVIRECDEAYRMCVKRARRIIKLAGFSI